MSSLFIFSVIFVSFICCQANTDVNGHANSTVKYNNYDFTGRDFRNTQTKRLCLLARLNASFEITYNSSTHKEIFVPKWASTSHSQCDYYFLSILRLEFLGVSYQLYFKRDEIRALHTQRTYCDQCDTGHWKLDEVEISIQNASWIDDIFPHTRLQANVVGPKLAANGDEITTGVSVARGYNCYDHILSAQLSIHDAIDLKTHHNATDDWKLVIHLYGVEIQPFLVTNDNIKDPVLCRDVTTFVVLIITIPLVYFFFFVVIYRLKERYGCPSCCNRKHTLAECNGSDKKPLVDTPSEQPLYKNVSVTRTSPDQAQHALL